jgi:outer membrane protein, heavy metal efflux system
LLRQAAADIEAAKGGAIQARLYPNPTLGTSSYTFGPGGGPYYGLAGSATIKTMGKLKLAYAAAEMNVKNAELAYRKAETDLMTQVRTYYFAVLVAQESMRAQRALVQLTDELYRVMAAQFRGGDRAVYEPMQVGVLTSQARANFLMARNSGQLAWKQLASSLGLPAMPPTQLEGRADMPLPRFEYDKALARVLALHTDVASTGNIMRRARYNLRLAEVAPFSDIVIAGSLMQDATPPTFGPNRVIWNGLQGVATVPIFDRNQGGIEQAQGSLLRAVEEPHRVRAELTARFAEAFRRYDENRALLDLYRTAILPQQVQAFRAAVKRHYGAGAKQVAYTDLIQSEQSLVAVVGTYLMILGAEWQAVADVAGFLQTDDLFQLAEGTYPSAVPELHQLLELPCCHPCGAPPGVGAAGTSSWIPSALSLGQRD